MKTRAMSLALAVAAAASLGSQSAWAQSFEEASAAGQVAIDGRQPFATLSERGELSRAWSVNGFYALYADGAAYWIVRRAAGTHLGQQAVLWADSRSCPALKDVLVTMEKIDGPRPVAAGLRGNRPIGMVLDGVSYTFWNAWGVSGPSDATVSFEVRGNVNSPVAKWWETSAPKLKTCWSASAPPR